MEGFPGYAAVRMLGQEVPVLILQHSSRHFEESQAGFRVKLPQLGEARTRLGIDE